MLAIPDTEVDQMASYEVGLHPKTYPAGLTKQVKGRQLFKAVGATDRQFARGGVRDVILKKCEPFRSASEFNEALKPAIALPERIVRVLVIAPLG